MSKSKEERAAYMREYRRTSLHYKVIEVPKQKLRNRLRAKIWLASAEKRKEEKVRKETIKWIYNYWRVLKEEGMTEKQFIVRFDKYLKSNI